MKIAAKYSHLNGLESLLLRRKHLWDEIELAIKNVNAFNCRTKESKEKGKKGEMLFSPTAMNQKFKEELSKSGWVENRQTMYTTDDPILLKSILEKKSERQKEIIENAGKEALMTYNQTDFLKDKVSIEIQFGKYAFVAHDLFVKHMSFFSTDEIDLGIEILPMKQLERQMSSGVPYYERDLLNLLRQGRSTPAVPLVLIGIVP